MTQDTQAGAGAQPAPAQQPEAQRLAQFLLNMQTRLGSCREACGDEHSMKAWDDYTRAAALLAAKGALDERELFEAWVRTHEDAHGAFDDGSARAGWEARAALATAPAQAVPSGMWTIWEALPGYLIDHCEGEIISEEGLQRALVAMLENPQYSMPPAAPAQGWSSECDSPELCRVHGGCAGQYGTKNTCPSFAALNPCNTAAPAQAVAVPCEVNLPDVEDMAHSAVQEALSYGVSHDVFHRWMRAVMDKTVQALAAAPAQEHATQLAGQGQDKP